MRDVFIYSIKKRNNANALLLFTFILCVCVYVCTVETQTHAHVCVSLSLCVSLYHTSLPHRFASLRDGRAVFGGVIGID